ncbi:chemotaxis protein CheD [Carboxydothermus islandicus]|uniref:Probable chemoreceptor glutamine deamidase CheD n=2 Tax=Carboxydothermus TaxID=129957 RepID=A0A1L8D4S3_9THEO|nr:MULTISPECIES: chemotaxis protein CheD [Carboxydothermus]NYE56918.1 chemotaxis protein CheD [Carboxydothermus ferrireducens DSM 11255]GAV26179.1 chemotaxis protein CheD [Carboxydothermus islandicus]
MELQVGIADYKLGSSPVKIVTYGLGSCVGVSFYEPRLKLGALLHIMLPDSTQFSGQLKPEKFADTGIPLVVRELEKQGARKSSLEVKMVGGAQMFSGPGAQTVMNIGERNIAMCRKVIAQMGLKLVAEDVGGNKGRTMILDTATGNVTVKIIGNIVKVI